MPVVDPVGFESVRRGCVDLAHVSVNGCMFCGMVARAGGIGVRVDSQRYTSDLSPQGSATRSTYSASGLIG